jgi:tetratricopeptide (TPR) repeat protein
LEATGYVSLGIIYDNQDKYHQAIENYKQYFQICEQMGDVVGCACACNCLGVDYMLMVCPPSDVGTLQGGNIDIPNAASHLQKAVDYHTQHLEIGPDDGDRFVANINLGLCLGVAGNLTQAAKHFQDALRIAIKMQTLYGQSIAVGNLGMLALIKGDFGTAQTCFEQHLQLVQALQDPEAEVKAWKVLAQLNHDQGNYAKAIDNLENARKIAVREKFANELRAIHCLIGISKGSVDWESMVM